MWGGVMCHAAPIDSTTVHRVTAGCWQCEMLASKKGMPTPDAVVRGDCTCKYLLQPVLVPLWRIISQSGPGKDVAHQ